MLPIFKTTISSLAFQTCSLYLIQSWLLQSHILLQHVLETPRVSFVQFIFMLHYSHYLFAGGESLLLWPLSRLCSELPQTPISCEVCPSFSEHNLNRTADFVNVWHSVRPTQQRARMVRYTNVQRKRVTDNFDQSQEKIK